MKSPPQHVSPTLRLYLRRSKADEGHQQFTLDVQREGCERFAREQLPGRGIVVAWPARVEYVDDDRAGDDFLGRVGLRRLRDEVRSGDVVLCRDQSRLGRDALEVTLAIRDLVRDRGARLFYYTTNQEVAFANAIDQATTFILGTGHQIELEAIRSRTREALRSRVRAGRIAGGRCYGYALRRETDASGRPYTVAVIDAAQAAVVVRIFESYAIGHGLKHITIGLNNEGIPPPRAGKRGTGSWVPSCIRAILLNPRYRGTYVHGRVDRVRRGGKRIKVISSEPPITLDRPDWRIVSDDLWLAVQRRFGNRKREVTPRAPAAKFALAGIARCGICGGSIGAVRTKLSGGTRAPAYACIWHRQRGASVCPVTTSQPVADVEQALADEIKQSLFNGPFLRRVLTEARAQVQQQLAPKTADTSATEQEITRLRKELRNLIQLGAAGGEEIPELAAALRDRQDRIRSLENDLAVSRRTPELVAEATARMERAIRDHLAAVRATLEADPGGAREIYRRLLPEGLKFRPTEVDGKQVYEITGTIKVRECVTCVVTPPGIEPGSST